MSILLSLLLFVLAGLICYATGGFASRLAGCLAFATATKSYALFQVTSFNCLNSLHGFISILILKINAFSFACKRKTLPLKIAYILKKYITITPQLSRRILRDSRLSSFFSFLFLFWWIAFLTFLFTCFNRFPLHCC